MSGRGRVLSDRLRVAVVGCGAMGSRHAAVIARDPACELLTVDLLPERAAALAERLGGRASPWIPEEIDAAVIATPTPTHVELAAPLLARGVWCLVEKPLADRPSAARRLAHPRCAVGHVERFNPAVRAAGALRPRSVDARRLSPPTGRCLETDVVLDLMIHDLDLILGWAEPGATVGWIEAFGTDDTASVRLQTSCGLLASLAASRIAGQREGRERIIRCDEPAGFTVLDLLAGRAWRSGVELERPDGRDALTCQWEWFVGAVRGDRDLPESGIRAVELADRIRSAMREGERPAEPLEGRP